MKRFFLRLLIVALTSLFFINAEAVAQENISRYEVGGQFSSLARNKPTSQNTEFADIFRHEYEPGVGGRFTFNVTNDIAFEAEFNFFPRQREAGVIFVPLGESSDIGVPGGRIYQGQFGIKAGKRFRRFGVFGKVRPGFVTFTEVSRVLSIRPIVFETRLGEAHVRLTEFGLRKETYSSTDIGVVLELYPSRRIVTRFDLGDTIIHYSAYGEKLVRVCAGGFVDPFCGLEVYTRPAEYRHNVQFSAGIGIRF